MLKQCWRDTFLSARSCARVSLEYWNAGALKQDDDGASGSKGPSHGRHFNLQPAENDVQGSFWLALYL